ncbi:hypothetical protein PR048_002898 [Dryococelus australis]|uniref:Uncharacterized protein n=1 Tax=Dryococelus australis TaxID=614101 RepID=A0ABQ9IMW9_9NEOP|nr:hypothetical protein PR048_002898 [Dryococelus australis]
MQNGFNPRSGTPGFPHVEIVLDDAVGRWVFSGISRFPRPFIPALLHTHHRLIDSEDLAVKSRPNGRLCCGETPKKPARWSHLTGWWPLLRCFFNHRGPGFQVAEKIGVPVVNYGEDCSYRGKAESFNFSRRYGAAPECSVGENVRSPRKPPPTCGIVRHDSHMQKPGSDPAGSRTRPPSLTNSDMPLRHLVTISQRSQSTCEYRAPHATKMASLATSQQHTGTPFANRRLVTYLPASSPANRLQFAAYGSQSDARSVPRLSHNQGMGTLPSKETPHHLYLENYEPEEDDLVSGIRLRLTTLRRKENGGFKFKDHLTSPSKSTEFYAAERSEEHPHTSSTSSVPMLRSTPWVLLCGTTSGHLPPTVLVSTSGVLVRRVAPGHMSPRGTTRSGTAELPYSLATGKWSKFCYVHSNALFRTLHARSMHGAWPPGAAMTISMSHYSLHVKSMAALILLSSVRSLAVCLTIDSLVEALPHHLTFIQLEYHMFAVGCSRDFFPEVDFKSVHFIENSLYTGKRDDGSSACRFSALRVRAMGCWVRVPFSPVSPCLEAKNSRAQRDAAARPRSRNEGAIRATITRTSSALSLLRARRAVFPSVFRKHVYELGRVTSYRKRGRLI